MFSVGYSCFDFSVYISSTCFGATQPILNSYSYLPSHTTNLQRKVNLNLFFVNGRKHFYVGEKYVWSQTVFKPFSGTDTTFVFVLSENTPLLFFLNNNSNGLSCSGFIHTRSVLLLVYIGIVCFKCKSYHICRKSLLHRLKCRKQKLTNGFSRKIRRYLARFKHRLVVQLVIFPVLMSLLLCGDIHPNPGPVFLPHSRRHPDAQSLIAGSWNVRGLLDTKRTSARPTAIVSHELAR